MMHRIVRAKGRRDFSIEIVFDGGEHALVDLSGFVADGEVTRRLREDPEYFVNALDVVDDGDAIGWPEDVHVDADALWYKAHPEDWERDFGSEAGVRSKRLA